MNWRISTANLTRSWLVIVTIYKVDAREIGNDQDQSDDAHYCTRNNRETIKRKSNTHNKKWIKNWFHWLNVSFTRVFCTGLFHALYLKKIVSFLMVRCARFCFLSFFSIHPRPHRTCTPSSPWRHSTDDPLSIMLTNKRSTTVTLKKIRHQNVKHF